MVKESLSDMTNGGMEHQNQTSMEVVLKLSSTLTKEESFGRTSDVIPSVTTFALKTIPVNVSERMSSTLKTLSKRTLSMNAKIYVSKIPHANGGHIFHLLDLMDQEVVASGNTNQAT